MMMYTFSVVTYIGGRIVYDKIIKGKLDCYGAGYYKIKDEDGKDHFFPIQFTIIQEI